MKSGILYGGEVRACIEAITGGDGSGGSALWWSFSCRLDVDVRANFSFNFSMELFKCGNVFPCASVRISHC